MKYRGHSIEVGRSPAYHNVWRWRVRCEKGKLLRGGPSRSKRDAELAAKNYVDSRHGDTSE